MLFYGTEFEQTINQLMCDTPKMGYINTCDKTEIIIKEKWLIFHWAKNVKRETIRGIVGKYSKMRT